LEEDDYLTAALTRLTFSAKGRAQYLGFHPCLLLFILLLCLTAGIAQGEEALKLAELGDFRLENGEIIRKCRVGYRTFGTLNEDKSNVVLFPMWFAGTTQNVIDLGLIGPDKLLDSSRFFVIAVDAFGNGVSSSPSTSRLQPGRTFPQFSIVDMVKAQHRLITRELGLTHLHAVVGISMGGMQVFQWMVTYPDFLDSAAAIVGTPRLASYDLLLWRAELGVIDAACAAGHCGPSAMQTVAPVHLLALQTPHYLVAHTSPEDFPQLLAAAEKNLMKYNARDWASQLKAMLGHDIYKPYGESAELTAATVQARVLVIVSQEDQAVNPEPALAFARLLKAETVQLTSDCGHLAFVCESDAIRIAVNRFLNQ
jgi:homoserine O-acetyltransferase